MEGLLVLRISTKKKNKMGIECSLVVFKARKRLFTQKNTHFLSEREGFVQLEKRVVGLKRKKWFF